MSASRILLALLVPALAAWPWLAAGDYWINLGSQILIAAMFALSLNILVGYAGLTSLGHAGYLGLSAYTSGWLILNLQWGHVPAALAAVGGTTLVAALFGLVALRASGLSFLMITLALGQILWGVAYRWASITGGDNGLSGLSRPAVPGLDLNSASHFYWFALLAFLLVWGLIAIAMRSPFGASLRGTRDQPRRMTTLGFNVWLIRYLAFVASGFFASIAGLMYVWYHQFISPHSLSLANAAEMLLMVIAGGPATLSGPVLGAALVVLLKNVASSYIDRWIMLLGLVFVLIVMFVPGGIVPGLARLAARVRARLKPAVASPAIATDAAPAATVTASPAIPNLLAGLQEKAR